MAHSVLDAISGIKCDLCPQELLCLNEITAFLPPSASFHFTFRFLFEGFQKTLFLWTIFRLHKCGLAEKVMQVNFKIQS